MIYLEFDTYFFLHNSSIFLYLRAILLFISYNRIFYFFRTGLISSVASISSLLSVSSPEGSGTYSSKPSNSGENWSLITWGGGVTVYSWSKDGAASNIYTTAGEASSFGAAWSGTSGSNKGIPSAWILAGKADSTEVVS